MITSQLIDDEHALFFLKNSHKGNKNFRSLAHSQFGPVIGTKLKCRFSIEKLGKESITM